MTFWRRAEAWPVALVAALALLAAYPLSAFVAGPLVLPALIVVGGAAVVATARPDIGVALAIVAVPISNFGWLGPWPGWVPVSAWIAFVFAMVMVRTWLTSRTDRLALADQPTPILSAAVLAFLAVTILGFAIADDQDAALPTLRTTAVGTMLFFATALGVRDHRGLRWVLGGMAAAASIVGGVAVREYVSDAPSQVGFITEGGALVQRVVAGFGHPNELGGFLLVLTPFLLAGALMRDRGQPYYVVALALAVAGIVLSFSRSALLALLVVPVPFMTLRRLVVLLPALICVAILAAPGVVRERFAGISEGGGDVATRVDIWRAAGEIWAANPLIGVGAGGFPQAYAEARIPGKQYLPDTILEPPPHAHNLFLQQLAESGLLGLVVLLAVLALAFRAALVARHAQDRRVSLLGTACITSLIVFLIHNLFDVTLVERTSTLFFLILGIIAALFAVQQRPQPAMTPIQRAGR